MARHNVIRHDCVLGVGGEGNSQLPSLFGGSQPADLPFDLSGVEPELLGCYKSFGVPLLEVKRHIDKDKAVLFQSFDALETADQLPYLIRFELHCGIITSPLARLVYCIQCDLLDAIPIHTSQLPQ